VNTTEDDKREQAQLHMKLTDEEKQILDEAVREHYPKYRGRSEIVHALIKRLPEIILK